MTSETRPSSVKAALTADRPTPQSRKRHRAPVENASYSAFCARIIRATGRRIAGGDVECLPELINLTAELDQALAAAVTGLRAYGYSWAEIAARLGTTRQAAQQRWSTTRSSSQSA
jgi:hypothetical protein